MTPTHQISDTFLQPTFVEYDDCVFLASRFSEVGYQFWSGQFQEKGKGKGAIESHFNTVPVHELFLDKPSELTPGVAREVGRTVLDVWKTKLHLDFPDRNFEFRFSLGNPPRHSYITFHQTKHEPSLFCSKR